MTHDSIGLGEDGPTHQPIEALALCRATPNVHVIRPGDGNETSGAYLAALEHKHSPIVLALSRQDMPQIPGTSIAGVLKGAYVVSDPEEKGGLDLVFVGSGSELTLAVDAAKKLAGKKRVRVVSMPSTTIFDQQPVDYRRSVIPPGVPTVSLEALATYGWERYSHFQIGMTTFGASAPLKAVMDKFGFTPDKVVAQTAAFLETVQAQAESMKQPAVWPLPTHFELRARAKL